MSKEETITNNSEMKPKLANERIILGIDPGTIILGYGLVLEQHKKLSLISLGVLKMGHIDDHFSKLDKIFEKTLSLIDTYHPDCLAVEAPFYGKNVQVMLKLGRAQGAAIAAALYRKIPVFEYAPKKVKQSITGNGNASKEQVAAMMQSILNFKETPEFLDATDGLGVAVCHAFQNGMTSCGAKKKNYSSWETFVTDNKKRVVK